MIDQSLYQNIFGNIISKLKALKIYNMQENSLVYAEISSYYVGIKLVCDLIEELYQELFINTANSYGLEMWEDILYSRNYNNLDVTTRRNMIASALTIKQDGFNRTDMEKALNSIGIYADITEVPNQEKINISVYDYKGELCTYSKILSRIQKILPAHLEIFLDMGVFSWDMFDINYNDFDEFDSYEVSFDEFEMQNIIK